VGTRVALPTEPGEPSPELVRTLCARAGLRLSDTDFAAIAAALAAHRQGLEQLRTPDLPEDEPGFDVAWD
jgi:hypothetical protein